MPGVQPAMPVYLGLGSNLGDRASHLRRAVRDLAACGVTIERTSPIYAGPYVGPGPPQPEYWNSVVAATTHLLPAALLRVTTQIERLHGREPGSHSRPRTLDIDLLFYAGWRIRTPELVVPHPRLWDRRFVLEPLAALGAGSWIVNLSDRIHQLRPQQPLRLQQDSLAEVVDAIAAQ